MLRRVRKVISGQWSAACLPDVGRAFSLPPRFSAALVLLLSAAHAQAAIFPDQIGGFTKGASKALTPPDAELYNEYGLLAAEQAEYSKAPQRFTATAWHMRDSTGAMALFQSLRPTAAASSNLSELAVSIPGGALLAFDNYVFQFAGYVPSGDELEEVYGAVPELEPAALPALPGFLPREGLIPNSERYLLGPVSLARFESRIAPSMAAFHLSAEGQLAKYQSPKGPVTLVVFEYPTPNIARERYQEFQGIAGAVAKRSGPLVGVIVQPPDSDSAERVLGQLRYEAKVTLNEKPAKDESKDLANLILNIFAVSGVLVGLSILFGIAFGGFRAMLRKIGIVKEEDEPMTVLRIGK